MSSSKTAPRKAAAKKKSSPAARKAAPAAKKARPAARPARTPARKQGPAAKERPASRPGPAKKARPAARRPGPAKKARPAARKPRTAGHPTPVGVVEEVLRKAEWDFERNEEDGWTTLVTRVDEGGATIATVARISEEASRFVLYAILAPSAHEAVRGEVAEFVTRANWGLNDGNFELDLQTGEVRFKIGIDFSGLPLAHLLVRNAILDTGDVLEVYEGPLLRVLRGEAGAAEAIAAVEPAAWEA